MGYLDDYLGAAVIRVPTMPGGIRAPNLGPLGSVLQGASETPWLAPVAAGVATAAWAGEEIYRRFHPTPAAPRPAYAGGMTLEQTDPEVRRYQMGNTQQAPSAPPSDPWQFPKRTGSAVGGALAGAGAGWGLKDFFHQLDAPAVDKNGNPVPNPNLQPTLVALVVIALGVAAVHEHGKGKRRHA